MTIRHHGTSARASECNAGNWSSDWNTFRPESSRGWRSIRGFSNPWAWRTWPSSSHDDHHMAEITTILKSKIAPESELPE